MTSEKEIYDLRDKLLARRRDILELRRTVNASWQTLQEPEKELEETASRESMSRGLAQLDDRGQAQIHEIDNALTKIDEGRYGQCEGCRRPIALNRLRAVPETPHCVRCAHTRESLAEGDRASRPVSLHQEALTDEELVATIQDALQTDGRVDLEELDIGCEDGALFLSGVLPSDSQHEILLEIVNDVLDFDETVDNIKIDRQPWERPERSPAPRPGRAEKETMMDGDNEQVDAHKSLSDGEPMTPPDELVPEEER